jgi:5'-nucleotidase (lipoprotein e(P4) family)
MCLAFLFLKTKTMKKTTFIILLSFIILSSVPSCKNSEKLGKNRAQQDDELVTQDHLAMATLYQQTSAEYRALCYQAFNLALLQLNQSSKMLGGMKKAAIVVDIDETMLDNSPYEAQCVLDNVGYPEGWDEWMNQSRAEPVPGALDFLNTAKAQGADIFYITNRKEKYRKQTLKNLQLFEFPDATNEHLMLKAESSSKKARRDKVSQTHNIIMLIGDNLNDFSEIFESKNITDRFALTDNLKKEFGARFIILPNAMYGEWESALYDYNFDVGESAKSKLRKRNLKGFKE